METTVQTLNRPSATPHRDGQTVDKVDQVSSVVLLGLAVIGAVLVVGLSALTH